MKTRLLAIALIVIGLGLTGAALFGQFVLTDDEGHHNGREASFALSTTVGADELIADESTPGEPELRIERAGQVLVDYDEVHGARFHTYAVAQDLTSYLHRAAEDESDTGEYSTGLLPGGEHRVVVQAAPGGGPDLLELGVDVAGGTGTTSVVALDDEWSDGAVTVTRQGLDFVLSEPWTGEDHMGGPAFLALFRAGDLAFLHSHAQLIGDDRFSFVADLPGRGEYLAAVEFNQDGELVTALFHFEI